MSASFLWIFRAKDGELMKVDYWQGGMMGSIRVRSRERCRRARVFFFHAPTCWPRTHCCRGGSDGSLRATHHPHFVARRIFFHPVAIRRIGKTPPTGAATPGHARPPCGKTTSNAAVASASSFRIVFFPICTVYTRTEHIVIRCVPPRGLDVVFCLHDHPDGFHHVSSPCCMPRPMTL